METWGRGGLLAPGREGWTLPSHSCLPKAAPSPVSNAQGEDRPVSQHWFSKPHRATAELHIWRRQARRQTFREDGGFLRKRMQMREERELLIHVMSAELSMTN